SRAAAGLRQYRAAALPTRTLHIAACGLACRVLSHKRLQRDGRAHSCALSSTFSHSAMMLTPRRGGRQLPEGVLTMPLGMLGLKVGMTQVYDDKGQIAPVTVLQVGPCPVLQIRAPEPDGYHAVQLGFLDKPRRKAIRAERGHVAEDLVSR